MEARSLSARMFGDEVAAAAAAAEAAAAAASSAKRQQIWKIAPPLKSRQSLSVIRQNMAAVFQVDASFRRMVPTPRLLHRSQRPKRIDTCVFHRPDQSRALSHPTRLSFVSMPFPLSKCTHVNVHRLAIRGIVHLDPTNPTAGDRFRRLNLHFVVHVESPWL